MCQLCNDDLVITLVDMQNLSSFGCHQRSRDLLTKDMRDRDVPSGVPKICTHKFRKFDPTKLAKQIGK